MGAKIRERARPKCNRSNIVTLEALARGRRVGSATPKRDLADVARTWVEDAEVDRAIAAQHRIDRRF